MKNCLYICQNAIGDVITSLPSIHFLRRIGFEVDILINEIFHDIFVADPNINKIYKAPSYWFNSEKSMTISNDDLKRVVNKNYYDLIIDSFVSELTKKLVGIINHEVSTGIQFDSSLPNFTKFVPYAKWTSWSEDQRNVSDCFADLLRESGLNYENTPPILYISRSSEFYAEEWFHNNEINPKNAIAISPGAGNELKKYPIERFIELEHFFLKNGYETFFIFGPKELDLLKSIQGKIKKYYLSFESEVQNIGAILRSSLCTISNDSAMMHVSASVGTRTIGIFGPTKSSIWFPYRQPWNRVIEKDIECRKTCLTGCDERPCFNDIYPQEIYNLAKQMLC